jgi:protocatechuate 3,4-dioxygenase beta subunit
MKPQKWIVSVVVVAVALVLGYFWFRGNPPAKQLPSGQNLVASESAPKDVSSATPARKAAQPIVLAKVDAGPESSVAQSVEDPAAVNGALAGQVVSVANRHGVPEAELTFQAGDAALTTFADADGRFRFSPPTPGHFLLAMVQAKGFLPFAPEWGQSPIAFEAAPGKRIEGVTVALTPVVEYLGEVDDDKSGDPIAGAEIRLLGDDANSKVLVPLGDHFTSDDKGVFHFHAPDFAVLEAHHRDYAPARAQVDYAVQASHHLVLTLTRGKDQVAASIIRGRVVDGQQQPVAGAVVTASFQDGSPGSGEIHPGAQTTADAAGHFELSGLDSGLYEVDASTPNLAPARVEGVEAGASNVVLTLGPGSILRGRVTDDRSGKPVPRFAVSVWRTRGPLRKEVERASTVANADGVYEVEGLSPGAATVQVSAPDYAPSAEQPVTLGDAPSHSDFVLSSGAHLRGTVNDRVSTQPIAAARVTLEVDRAEVPGSLMPIRAGVTDERGRFELTGLSPGPLTLFVTADGHHARIVVGQTVPPTGDPADVAVTLNPVKPGEDPGIELTGIGAVIAVQGEALVIGKVLPGGGAAAAGLGPGDLVTAIDGQPVTQLGYTGAIGAIRGPEGTPVVLSLQRNGLAQQITVWRQLIRG